MEGATAAVVAFGCRVEFILWFEEQQ